MYNFTQAFERNVDRSPDQVVVTFEGRAVTNRELLARVEALAQALAGLGVEAGDVVGLLLYNHPDFLEATLAINKVGAIFLPLNFRLAPPEWQYILNHAGCSVLITESDFLPGVQSVRSELTGLQRLLRLGNEDGDG